MITKQIVFLAAIFFTTAGAFSTEFTSKYVDHRHQEIKSLTPDDIEELKKGAGWGLAKAAELNGVPGPAHILEMKAEISLTKEQELKIQAIYDAMNAKAVASN